MRYGIYIHGLAIPRDSEADESWLAYYDPTKHGLRGEIRTTKDPAQAKAFATQGEAIVCWQQAHGIRPDGQPNRPLTAFTVSIERLPEVEERTCEFHGTQYNAREICPICVAEEREDASLP